MTNRVIKFRAWDEKSKSYWKPGEALPFNEGSDSFYLSEEGQPMVFCADDGGKNGLHEHMTDEGKNLVIEQFTGLLDKNGVEIYEGDICKTKAWGHLVKVEWNPICAGFQMADEKNEFWEELHVSDEYEVIGNIHQSPELLK